MEIKFKKYWRTSSFKNKKDGNFLLRHIEKIKPKNFLEIGVFHGVTSRNVCEILYSLHGNDFKFTGIDLFSTDKKVLDELERCSKIIRDAGKSAGCLFHNQKELDFFKSIGINLLVYSVDSSILYNAFSQIKNWR